MGIEYGEKRSTFIDYGRPSLFLDFAKRKSLVDAISKNNLITFTRSSTGTYVGSDGLIKTAAVDEARFDHDPATGESLGLLIEEQRTNLMPYSSNTTIYSSANVTTSRTTGFDGNPTSGFNVVYNSNSASFVLTSTAAVTSGNTYTFSVYIKKNVNSTSGNQGIVMYSYFDNGTAGQWSGSILNEDGKNLSQAPVGVWKRYSKTITVTSGTGVQIILPGYDTSGLDVTYYNSQIELGAFPTSAIPTSGSTVTRQPDNAQITGTNFTDFYNPTESTIFVEAHVPPIHLTQYAILSLETNNNNRLNSIAFTKRAGQGSRFLHYDNSDNGDVDLTNSVSWSDGSYRKLCGSIGQVSASFADNGTIIGTDSSYQLPSSSDQLSKMRIGGFTSGGVTTLTGHIKQLLYYPTRLTNTQLQALTQ